MTHDDVRCEAVAADALAAAEETIWPALLGGRGLAATPTAAATTTTASSVGGRPVVADAGVPQQQEAEAHFGLAVRRNRVDFSTPVPAVPLALVEAVTVASSSAATRSTSSTSGQATAGDRRPAAPNTCSVRVLPAAEGAYSDVVVEADLFERPILLLPLGDCALEVSVQGGSVGRGSGSGDGAAAAAATGAVPSGGDACVVRVPRGHVGVFGGQLAAPPFKYRVRAVPPLPSPLPTTAVTTTDTSVPAPPSSAPAATQSATNGGGGGGGSIGGCMAFAVLRHCRILTQVAELVAAVAAGTLSKTQLKRQIRALTKTAAAAAAATAGGATKRPHSSTEEGGAAAGSVDGDGAARKKATTGGGAGGAAKSLPLPAHMLPSHVDGGGGGGGGGVPGATAAAAEVKKLPNVEAEHVQRVCVYIEEGIMVAWRVRYDSIAPHWHGTRYRTWPRVEEFVATQPVGSLIGDFGCGNGKNLPACRARIQGQGVGFDFSMGLLDICRNRGGDRAAAATTTTAAAPTGDVPPRPGHSESGRRRRSQDNSCGGGGGGGGGGSSTSGAEAGGATAATPQVPIAAKSPLEVVAADAVNLPVRDGAFDAALSIAVLHHISSKARRLRLVEQTMRAVRVGGQALFYAWALEQDRGNRSGHRFAAQDVLVPWHLAPKHATALQQQHQQRQQTQPQQPQQQESAAQQSAALQPAGSVAVEAASASGAETPASVAPPLPQHAAFDQAKSALVLQRYCHVYKEGELRALFEPLAGWVRVVEEYFDCGNWCIVAECTRPPTAAAAAAAAVAADGAGHR